MLWQNICKKIEKSFLNIYLCLFVTSLFVNKLLWKICVSFLNHSKRKLLQTLNTNSYLSPGSYGFDQFLCGKLLYKMGHYFLDIQYNYYRMLLFYQNASVSPELDIIRILQQCHSISHSYRGTGFSALWGNSTFCIKKLLIIFTGGGSTLFGTFTFKDNRVPTTHDTRWHNFSSI